MGLVGGVWGGGVVGGVVGVVGVVVGVVPAPAVEKDNERGLGRAGRVWVGSTMTPATTTTTSDRAMWVMGRARAGGRVGVLSERVGDVRDSNERRRFKRCRFHVNN